MSNPLIKPNDPRFQKPDIRDPGGKNRFGESEQPTEEAPPQHEAYSAGASDEARPFVPHYEAQQRSRSRMWLVLGGLGWGAAVLGGVSLAGLLPLGWICPLLGVGPAGSAWLLAYEELKAIRVGAIDDSARPRTQHAFWLGFTGLVACLAVVAAMLYRKMNFLPDI
jgi:hypothetical protein